MGSIDWRFEGQAHVVDVDVNNRAEWEEARYNGLGGSDVAGAMGVPTAYSDPLTVYKTKRKEYTPGQDAAREERFWFGHAHEETLRARFMRDRLDMGELRPGKMLRHPEYAWALANPDGIYEEDGEPIIWEAKTAGSSKGWGKDSPLYHGIPEHYYAQVQWYMWVTGYESAIVSVLFGAYDYQEYPVLEDAEYQARLFIAGLEMTQRILAGEPPAATGHPSSAEVLKQIRTNGAERELPRELAYEFAAAYEANKKARTEYDRVVNLLRQKMGDASYATCDGIRIARRIQYKREVFDKARLQRNLPGIYDKYVTESETDALYPSITDWIEKEG